MANPYESLLDDESALVPDADLAEAVRRFEERSGEDERWARFAVPLRRLSELLEIEPAGTVPLAVVAPPTLIADDWSDMLEDAVEILNTFVEGAGDLYEIESFEARIPDVEEVADYVQDLSGFSDAEVFIEFPSRPGIGEALAPLADADYDIGAKLPADSDRLPEFLSACFGLEIAFKLTGGAPEELLPRIAVAMADDMSADEMTDLFDRGGRPATEEEMEDATGLLVAIGVA